MLPIQRNELERRSAAQEFVRGIPLDIILTVCLCGLWNIWIQARQMRAVNFMIGADKYKFWHWFFLCFITCGLYHLYHEYRMSKDIALANNMPMSDNPVIHLVLCLFGLCIVTDALQQSEINAYFNNHAL